MWAFSCKLYMGADNPVVVIRRKNRRHCALLAGDPAAVRLATWSVEVGILGLIGTPAQLAQVPPSAVMVVTSDLRERQWDHLTRGP